MSFYIDKQEEVKRKPSDNLEGSRDNRELGNSASNESLEKKSVFLLCSWLMSKKKSKKEKKEPEKDKEKKVKDKEKEKEKEKDKHKEAQPSNLRYFWESC